MRDATLPALRLGTVLDDTFVVEGAVASGRCSVVHRGTDRTTGRAVAIKVAWGDASNGLLRRAELIRRLSHPHLASSLGAGRIDGGGFHVLAWCEGVTMSDALERSGRQRKSPVEAIAWLTKIVDVVAHFHEHGLVHNDLKPGNILLGTHGPLLIDFGSVSEASEANEANETTGVQTREYTPAYAAPEQAVGARTGPPADVFALGMIFVELVCGRPPRSVSLGDAQAEIATNAGALYPVIERCLRVSPGERWQNAVELRRALETYRSDLGNSATVAALAREVAPHPTKTKNALQGSLIALGIVLFTGGVAAAALAYFLTARNGPASAAALASTSSTDGSGLGALTSKELKLRLARAGEEVVRETSFSSRTSYESSTVTTRSGLIATLFSNIRVKHDWLSGGFHAHRSAGDKMLGIWSPEPNDAARLLERLLDPEAPSSVPALPPPSHTEHRPPDYDVAELERRLRAARFAVTSKHERHLAPTRMADGRNSIGADLVHFTVERLGCAPISIEWHRNITEPSAIPKLMKRDVPTAAVKGNDAFMILSKSLASDTSPFCGQELLELLMR